MPKLKALDKIRWRGSGTSLVAAGMITVGIAVLFVGIRVSAPPNFWSYFLESHRGIGHPLIINGFLLWVINSIFRRNEKRRVISQLGSLSNEFALEAAREARKSEWLTDGSLVGKEFKKANLCRAELAGAVIGRANFSNANLRDANLRQADLREAVLLGVDLSGAELRWADLRGTNLRWAKLTNASLNGAKLDGADLRFAKLSGVDLDAVDLRNARVGGEADSETVALLRKSVARLRSRAEEVSSVFYDRLFAVEPTLRSLFVGDLKTQQLKFIQTLAMFVEGMDEPAKTLPIVHDLGKRHIDYAVKPEYFPTLKSVLLWTFDQQLGDELTAEVRDAWSNVYDLLATTMTDAMAEHD
jgi:hemoglobin-like flavoprotein